MPVKSNVFADEIFFRRSTERSGKVCHLATKIRTNPVVMLQAEQLTDLQFFHKGDSLRSFVWLARGPP